MSLFFFFEYLVDGKKDAAFLNIAEFVVDSGAKHSHCRRQPHIGMYKWRDIVAVTAHKGIEYAEIRFEITAIEYLIELYRVRIGF